METIENLHEAIEACENLKRFRKQYSELVYFDYAKNVLASMQSWIVNTELGNQIEAFMALQTAYMNEDRMNYCRTLVSKDWYQFCVMAEIPGYYKLTMSIEQLSTGFRILVNSVLLHDKIENVRNQLQGVINTLIAMDKTGVDVSEER